MYRLCRGTALLFLFVLFFYILLFQYKNLQNGTVSLGLSKSEYDLNKYITILGADKNNTDVKGSLGDIPVLKTDITESNSDILIKNLIQQQQCGAVRPTESHQFNGWHLLERASLGQVLVFNSFYDVREQATSGNKLRIFGVSSVEAPHDVYCQLWFKDIEYPLTTKALQQSTGRGLNHNGKHYQEKLYSCDVKLNTIPESVSLTFDECTNSSNIIPVKVPDPIQVHELGICMVVAYGTLDPKRLVEWMELNKLLGVGEINVCDSNINQEARNVFTHYAESEGNVVVRPVKPAVNSWCYWCQKLSAIPCVNECMYKNMYRYRRTVVIDFDEFIIPVEQSNLVQLIEFLDTKSYYQFMFRNTYFFQDFPTSDENTLLATKKHVTRVEPSGYGYSPKSIVDATKCLVMQNHYCMIPMKNSGYSLDVPVNYGKSHHYKMCHFSKEECGRLLKTPIHDDVARKYSTILEEKVRRKLEALGIKDTVTHDGKQFLEFLKSQTVQK